MSDIPRAAILVREFKLDMELTGVCRYIEAEPYPALGVLYIRKTALKGRPPKAIRVVVLEVRRR